MVGADVAAPDDLDPNFRQDRRHACGLRIMEEDDVTGTNASRKATALAAVTFV